MTEVLLFPNSSFHNPFYALRKAQKEERSVRHTRPIRAQYTTVARPNLLNYLSVLTQRYRIIRTESPPLSMNPDDRTGFYSLVRFQRTSSRETYYGRTGPILSALSRIYQLQHRGGIHDTAWPHVVFV